MRRVIFFLLPVFLITNSCKENALEEKARLIKSYSIQDGIFEKGLIYMASNPVSAKEIEYPNIKLFDRNGNPLDVGSCMNAIESIVNQVGNDTFRNIQINTETFNDYVLKYKLISIDNLKPPRIDSTFKYYLCYNWNHSLQFIGNAEMHKAIFQKMKKAQTIALQKKIKLLYIHFP